MTYGQIISILFVALLCYYAFLIVMDIQRAKAAEAAEQDNHVEEDIDISDEAQSFRPHKVSREEPKKEETCFEIGDYHFNSVTQILSHTGIEQELSHREAEILKRLCENRNQVVNTQNILLDLWGDDSFFNSRSLHVFITKLRHKLSKDERIRIVNVRGIGYKLIIN